MLIKTGCLLRLHVTSTYKQCLESINYTSFTFAPQFAHMSGNISGD